MNRKKEKVNFKDTFLRELPLLLSVVDENNDVAFINRELEKKVGKNVIGKKCYKIYRDDKTQCSNCPLRRKLETGEVAVIDSEGIMGGRVYRIRHKVIEESGKKYILEIFEDISDSMFDDLTDSYNRRKLEVDLSNEVERSKRYNSKFAILMIDIDWFKEYNDYHGHQKGDKVLIELVDIISENLRKNDRVYRYGGEEFVILLPETESNQARVVANKLREVVRERRFKGENQSQPNGTITISIGIASFPDLETIISEELIISADKALYRAKKSGKDRIVSL